MVAENSLLLFGNSTSVIRPARMFTQAAQAQQQQLISAAHLQLNHESNKPFNTLSSLADASSSSMYFLSPATKRGGMTRVQSAPRLRHTHEPQRRRSPPNFYTAVEPAIGDGRHSALEHSPARVVSPARTASPTYESPLRGGGLFDPHVSRTSILRLDERSLTALALSDAQNANRRLEHSNRLLRQGRTAVAGRARELKREKTQAANAQREQQQAFDEHTASIRTEMEAAVAAEAARLSSEHSAHLATMETEGASALAHAHTETRSLLREMEEQLAQMNERYITLKAEKVQVEKRAEASEERVAELKATVQGLRPQVKGAAEREATIDALRKDLAGEQAASKQLRLIVHGDVGSSETIMAMRVLIDAQNETARAREEDLEKAAHAREAGLQEAVRQREDALVAAQATVEAIEKAAREREAGLQKAASERGEALEKAVRELEAALMAAQARAEASTVAHASQIDTMEAHRAQAEEEAAAEINRLRSTLSAQTNAIVVELRGDLERHMATYASDVGRLEEMLADRDETIRSLRSLAGSTTASKMVTQMRKAVVKL